MEIKYIEAVLAVAEYLSFSRAAISIPCAQSSISRQVKLVESELGAELFTRSFNTGKVELTDYGVQAVPILREIYERYEAVTKLADQTVSLQKVTYRLGVYRGPFNSFAKAMLVSEMFIKHPDINIVIKEIPIESMLELLSRGSIDGAVYYKAYLKHDDSEEPEQTSYLIRNNLFCKNPCIAMQKNHPLANNQSVEFADLKDETFLLHHDNIKGRELINNIQYQGFLHGCLNAGFTPKIEVVSVDTIADIRDAAVLNYGWMYPSFATNAIRNNEMLAFVPISEPNFYAKYYMLVTNNKSEVSKIVMRDIRNILTRGDQDIF